MSQTAYPTKSDVAELLVSAGLRGTTPDTIESFLNIPGALASAIADWEQDTGLTPFLKDTNDVTFYYDPPGNQTPEGRFGSTRGGSRVLYLPSQNGSVWTSITSVTIGYSDNSAGTLLAANQDYYLEPRNAALNNKPYERINFIARSFGLIGSIVVVGKRGWPVVPDNVFRTITKKAAQELGNELLLNYTSGNSKIKLGDDEFTVDLPGFRKSVDGWGGAAYMNEVAKYRADVL